MMFPSFTLILSGVLIAYMSYSIYMVSLLFSVPSCTRKDHCAYSYLKEKPKLELRMYASTTRWPLRTEVTEIFSDLDFDYMNEKDIPLTLDVPRKTRQNGTLYLHVILIPQTVKIERTFQKLTTDSSRSTYARIQMTEYAIPQAETFNLLSEEENRINKKPSKKAKGLPVSHMKSRVAFSLMTEDVEFRLDNLPSDLTHGLRVTEDYEYLPILTHNFLYTRYKDLIKITPKMQSVNVTVSYYPISLGKLRLILNVEAAMQNFKQLGFSEKNIDEVKEILADTNLYLLAGAVFISAMHLLFDFLAFKNDISFWRSKNDLAGLSTQTVLWRAFSQAVIFLYLLDEGSSLLILVPAGIGTLIEFWKTKKILRAEIIWSGGILPKIRFNWSKCSSEETKTRQIDIESMRYLSYLLYPIVLLGAVYSLLYLPHKGWYSWTIHSLVNGVYAFGFLFMLPQLFVNYKLKSVAHLPWRSFMYKAFNTFIDDVFAFIITMPVAHRVACFRDDAIFLIYLYQRWLYPVDKSRLDSSTIDMDPSFVDSTIVNKKKK